MSVYDHVSGEFYWVRIRCDRWVIAEKTDDSWLHFGTECEFGDETFCEIGQKVDVPDWLKERIG